MTVVAPYPYSPLGSAQWYSGYTGVALVGYMARNPNLCYNKYSKMTANTAHTFEPIAADQWPQSLGEEIALLDIPMKDVERITKLKSYAERDDLDSLKVLPVKIDGIPFAFMKYDRSPRRELVLLVERDSKLPHHKQLKIVCSALRRPDAVVTWKKTSAATGKCRRLIFRSDNAPNFNRRFPRRAQAPQRRRVIAFGELLPVGVQQQAVVMIRRRRQLHQRLQQPVNMRGAE